MSESPLYFQGPAGALFGVLHRPAEGPVEDSFVLCAPEFEEKLWSHRVMVNIARDLAARRFAVLRFDYAGHGDSEGVFEEATVETRLADIQAATRLLQESTGTDRPGLLGLRFGATLAAVAADRDPEAYGRLVLWAPVARGSAHMQEMLRINLATQMAVYKEIRTNRKAMAAAMEEGRQVNVDGYGLAGPMFVQAGEIDLLAEDRRFGGPVLVAGVVRQEGAPAREAEQLAGRYRSATVRAVVEQPFWKEIKAYVPRSNGLTDATLDWLSGGGA